MGNPLVNIQAPQQLMNIESMGPYTDIMANAEKKGPMRKEVVGMKKKTVEGKKK